MNVSVFKPAGRKFFMAQWVDPVTGRKKTRSTGTAIKRDAERFAARLEAEIRAGTFADDARMTWDTFRDRFDDEYLSGLAKSTRERYSSALNSLQKTIAPKLLVALTESIMSKYQAELRKSGLAEATIKANLVHIKAALRWAVEQKFLQMAPKIRMPKNTETMKGRVITAEEFERMLTKVENIKTPNPESWRFLLLGLWWSGLRLGEALKLHWTDDRELCVDLQNELIVMQAGSHKRRKYLQCPMAPEFADMLKAVPEDQREGYVFNPVGSRKFPGQLFLNTACRIISTLGKEAGVVTGESASGKRKYASAHDLRRSFGFRWSRRIMPTELKELMRHRNISTTMEFYVGQEAKQTAKRLREVLANTLANSETKKANAESTGSP